MASASKAMEEGHVLLKGGGEHLNLHNSLLFFITVPVLCSLRSLVWNRVLNSCDLIIK